MGNPARAYKSPAEAIGGAIFGAAKPLYKEGEQRRRSSNRRLRESYFTRAPRTSQKDVVFSVLDRAIANAKGGAPIVGVRDLYYATRPLCYAERDWPPGKSLNYNYFSQTLLTEYQEMRAPIEGLYYDPRGRLHEPHTGKTVDLGTREVEGYEFPEYLFDKILYVEKEGEWPKIQAARIAERYDMAVVTGKGYATEAARTIFERAESGDYQLFVFHDADIDGYNICRTLRQQTRRMPGYNVEVIDLGLTIAAAEEMSLDAEPFERKQSIPIDLVITLDGRERDYFRHQKLRYELNAITPVSRRMEYIEEKLVENGVRPKMIPPEEELQKRASEMYHKRHKEWIDETLAGLLDDEIKEELADELAGGFDLQGARRYIEEGFEEDGALPWRKILEDKLEAGGQEHADGIREAVRGRVREALKESPGGGS
jgi:hypothetical protein